MTDVVLVFTTVPNAQSAEAIATALVEERLAACVSMLPPMISIYRWEGSLTRDEEQQLLIKTTADRVPALSERLKVLHPYRVPELLVCTVTGGSAAYLEWVRAETND